MSRKKKFFRNSIIIFSIVFLLLYAFQKYNSIIDIKVVEQGKLEDVIKTSGVIIKDEVVLKAKCSGESKYYYNEGDKVYKGLYIADIITANSSQQIDDEIKLIDEEIKNIANRGKSVITIGSGSGSKYSTYNQTELNNLRAQLVKAKDSNKIPFYSPKSGFVTYCFDGLEDIMKFNSVDDIMPERLLNLTTDEMNTFHIRNINSGDNLVKVINNFYYYVVCVVSNEEAKLFKENSYASVRFNNDNEKIYGWINNINTDGENSVLVISFNDFFYEIYNKRIVDIDLITNVHEGIIIQKEAVVERDGLTGVYIKDISNIIKFLPVEILSSDDKYYIVSQGKIISNGKRGIIKIEDTYYNTVKTFDKVVLDVDKVYEGEIVD
ncbi:hypothetical protein JYG23_05400 [Sedimentibacter sp. zth1]|uniref:HlyD family efflux transporter periplasmic adaptor subunit n=1 Tax=Sedimentibacter sp. zth1 TaxID=2816908 RepID=UPI001A935413|nr:HlyD family efflux transporter periplasmic adaptor subunit [Sedimentibacter sp. zth1]QSX06884.1 hypothetical protein JYG23_05400 [Sedimentibacter sp. zth1]